MSTRKLKLDVYFSPFTKFSPRRIQDLSVRPEILKLLKETQEISLQGRDMEENTVKSIALAKEVNPMSDKQDYMKLKGRKNENQQNRQPTEWVRTLSNLNLQIFQ